MTAVGQGTARIVADAGGKAGHGRLSVGPAGVLGVRTDCRSRRWPLAKCFRPTAMPPACARASPRPSAINAEYALTLISTATSFSSVTSLDVFATGNTGPTTAALVVGRERSAHTRRTRARCRRADVASSTSDMPRLAELERRALERRELTPLVDAARDVARRATGCGRARHAGGAQGGRRDHAQRQPQQGLQRARAIASSRVAAVGEKSIVVADNENPTGGYTDAEYASIAATFDTLVFPLDTTAFGAPTNVSGRGKVILFYTRSVNCAHAALHQQLHHRRVLLRA